MFAFFYHRDIKLDFTQNLDELPPVPKTQKGLSRGEAVAGIVFTVVFLIVFLLFPSVIAAVAVTEGGAPEMVPIFNTAYLARTWPLILLFGLVCIAQEVVRLIDGRYTLRVMISTLASNLISAVLAFIWLVNGQLLNPALFSTIGLTVNISPSADDFLYFFFSHMPQVLLVIILFSVVLDSVLTVYRTAQENGGLFAKG